MIRPGDPYGELASPSAAAIEVSSDAEASHRLAQARQSGQPLPELLLRGGDLHRTLGGGAATPSPSRSDATHGLRVPVDLGILRNGDDEWLFVAHAVLRRALWSGPFIVAMNAQWCGDLDLGPRSHPADGLLDLTEGRLDIRQRFTARSRARSGSHLPHPGLRTRRCTALEIELDGKVTAHIDGRRRVTLSSASFAVEPQAFIAYI